MSGVAVCVQCRERPVHSDWAPFCSDRCKLADLSRWLNGDYRIPGAPAAPPGGTPTEEPDSSEQ